MLLGVTNESLGSVGCTKFPPTRSRPPWVPSSAITTPNCYYGTMTMSLMPVFWAGMRICRF